MATLVIVTAIGHLRRTPQHVETAWELLRAARMRMMDNFRNLWKPATDT